MLHGIYLHQDFFLKHDLEVILGNYIIVKSDKMYLLKITIELSYLFSNC